jgi:ABC-type enterobactin transport system permease subunit
MQRVAAKAGVAVSAFAVFTAGWVAMKSEDWRVIVGVSVLALLASLAASSLTRRYR